MFTFFSWKEWNYLKHEKHTRVVVSNYDCRFKTHTQTTTSATACSLDCRRGCVVTGQGEHRAGGLWPAGDLTAWRVLRDLDPWGAGCHHTLLLPHLCPGRYCMAFTCKSTFFKLPAKPNAKISQQPKLLCQHMEWREYSNCSLIYCVRCFVLQIKNTAEVRRPYFSWLSSEIAHCSLKHKRSYLCSYESDQDQIYIKLFYWDGWELFL